MAQFIFGLGPAVANSADMTRFFKGVRHGLGVPPIVIDQENLRVDVCVARHESPDCKGDQPRPGGQVSRKNACHAKTMRIFYPACRYLGRERY